MCEKSSQVKSTCFPLHVLLFLTTSRSSPPSSPPTPFRTEVLFIVYRIDLTSLRHRAGKECLTLRKYG